MQADSAATSARELELRAFLERNVVIIEEVGVEHSLDEAGDPHKQLPVVGLSEEAVYPVDQVKPSVRPDAEDVEKREGLPLLGPLKHEELGDDCQRFQVDGKRPQNLLTVAPARSVARLGGSGLLAALFGDARRLVGGAGRDLESLITFVPDER